MFVNIKIMLHLASRQVFCNWWLCYRTTPFV